LDSTQVVGALTEPAACGKRVMVITNLDAEPASVPGGAQILVSSGPLTRKD
jgi:hypothetical protein